MQELNIVIQGYPGCFHQEAAQAYFSDCQVHVTPADSFNKLAELLQSQDDLDFGIMAIENNIAGSILQNYRILRENSFRIIGEIYLPIHHNFMVLAGQKIEDIHEVRSHPMALRQCLDFLGKYPDIKRVNSEDTALSAKQVADGNLTGIAAIGSKSAAALYGLEILGQDIESSDNNYTRFFILQRGEKPLPEGDYNKASIYLRTSHNKGSLLKVLEVIYELDINISKLQSYPVAGALNQYYFYLDLEFDNAENYSKAIQKLNHCTVNLEILGVYNRWKL